MDFVSDYIEKTELAEKLKRRQKALALLQPDTGAIVTPGGGNYPGQVQANWAGNLAKVGMALMGRNMEDKAEQADSDALAARNSALMDILGGGSGSTGAGTGTGGTGGVQAGMGRLRPEQLLAMEQLGIDPQMMKLMQPDKQALGAITQGFDSLGGIKALETMGVITPEQAEAGRQAIAEKDKKDKEMYLYEQQHKAFNPKTDKETEAQFKLRLYQTDPEAFNHIYGDKTLTGSGAKGGRYSPAREAQVLGEAATALESLITKEGKTMFGPEQTLAAGAREFGSKAGGIIGTAAEMAGTKMESPANAQMRAIGVDAALEAIAKMAPASDTDVQLLLRNKPNAFQNEQSAMAFVSLMKKVAERYKNFAPDTGPKNIEDMTEEELQMELNQ